MNIVEFFDPQNTKHILAYKTLEETGHWPKGFVSDDMERPAQWQILLLHKLANCWVEYQLQKAKGDRW